MFFNGFLWDLNAWFGYGDWGLIEEKGFCDNDEVSFGENEKFDITLPFIELNMYSFLDKLLPKTFFISSRIESSTTTVATLSS